ncbi:tyrosine-type recombinase/integrase [Mycobacterium paraterrae]|uniref:Site-specific integrase n=1 Tax=Mycobacterium paraterrae TaxID=577492 RepID=A0ABY3VTL5_9MYCO|nr:tyrosine-type recombinase/integrase [Mycobacterium paraterrae]UMB71771.1 site-specific integrase [Mycobacterium paraterrae]
MTAFKRGVRAGVEDRWHRPARSGERVSWPADQTDGPTWCIDAKHGNSGTLVCSARHGQGKRWLARWVARDGQERTKAFDRKADAQKHIEEMTVAVSTGTYSDPRRSAVTFGVIAEAWFATKAQRAPKTVAGYREVLDNVILPKWGPEPLSDVTHEGIQTWITWLSTNPAARQHVRKSDPNAGLSASRVIQTHQLVNQIFGYAIRAKYVAVNPATDIELPSKPQSTDLALTHDQVRQLAKEMTAAEDAIRHRSDTAAPRTTPEALGTMVRLLAYAGLRFGECAALLVGDVDIKKRRILVGKSITRVRGQGLVLGETKTHARRSAPILTTALADELKQWVAGRDASEFLFPGPDGEAMTVGWFRARFDKAVAKLGVEGVTPHTLRHSAGSLALASGASVVTVQKLLGHLNATTTMNRYSHMLPDDFDRLAAAMDKATSSP